jgi:hypothetical protein
MRATLCGFTILSLLLLAGCVRRTMVIHTDPPNALVYMNSREIGRTPIEKDFTWYGTYDVQVRKEGYKTLKTKAKVIAPWWQWIPFDFFAEFFPLTDRHKLYFTLEPASTQPADAQVMLERADELRAKMQSSQYTKTGTTHPSTTTAPTTRPRMHQF